MGCGGGTTDPSMHCCLELSVWGLGTTDPSMHCSLELSVWKALGTADPSMHCSAPLQWAWSAGFPAQVESHFGVPLVPPFALGVLCLGRLQWVEAGSADSPSSVPQPVSGDALGGLAGEPLLTSPLSPQKALQQVVSGSFQSERPGRASEKGTDRGAAGWGPGEDQPPAGDRVWPCVRNTQPPPPF